MDTIRTETAILRVAELRTASAVAPRSEAIINFCYEELRPPTPPLQNRTIRKCKSSLNTLNEYAVVLSLVTQGGYPPVSHSELHADVTIL